MTGRAAVARVAPDLTGLDKEFDYLVPAEFADRIRVGSLVRVPLGPRRVRAWVVRYPVDDPAVDVDALRPIASVVGEGPDAELMALARWAAWRWAGRLRPLLVTASPPRQVRRVPSSRRRAAAAGGPSGHEVRAVRLPPVQDFSGVLEAACTHGPVLAVCASVPDVGRLAAAGKALGLSVAQVPGDWAAAAGGVDLVVGPRSAAWAPCPGPGLFLVLDEHDEALQEERTPTWHARDVVVERARRAGAPCWLVSPVPTLEALALAGPRVDRPSRLDERAGWPIVEVVDRTREDPPLPSPVTRRLLELARHPDQRLVCVLGHPGRARRLVCRNCRARTLCDVCGAAVRQARSGALACDRCGASRPAACQHCGSTRLTGLGMGAARLAEELQAAIGRPVLEVSGQAEADPDVIASAGVIVGTEAVFHRVHDATTVVFVDFDDVLLAGRFRAGEEAMVLLVRAARLVGGRSRGGRVVVQTHLPNHEVIKAAVLADPARLVEAEWARRSILEFPPVRALATVTGVEGGPWLERLTPTLASVSGPADGRYLVRAADPTRLADALAALGPRPRGVTVTVDPRRI